MLDKEVDKIKEIIGIEKFDNTKILIDTDDKLPEALLQEQSNNEIFENLQVFYRTLRIQLCT